MTRTSPRAPDGRCICATGTSYEQRIVQARAQRAVPGLQGVLDLSCVPRPRHGGDCSGRIGDRDVFAGRRRRGARLARRGCPVHDCAAPPDRRRAGVCGKPGDDFGSRVAGCDGRGQRRAGTGRCDRGGWRLSADRQGRAVGRGDRPAGGAGQARRPLGRCGDAVFPRRVRCRGGRRGRDRAGLGCCDGAAGSVAGPDRHAGHVRAGSDGGAGRDGRGRAAVPRAAISVQRAHPVQARADVCRGGEDVQ